MLHEARYFEPLMRDLEAFLESTQRQVTGSVRMRLFKGQPWVEGVESDASLMLPDVALYGEENHLWDGRDAQGFCRLYALQDSLAARRDRRAGAPEPAGAGGR